LRKKIRARTSRPSSTTISKGAAQSWQMENRYKTMNEGKFDFGLFAPARMACARICRCCFAEARPKRGQSSGHSTGRRVLCRKSKSWAEAVVTQSSLRLARLGALTANPAELVIQFNLPVNGNFFSSLRHLLNDLAPRDRQCKKARAVRGRICVVLMSKSRR